MQQERSVGDECWYVISSEPSYNWMPEIEKDIIKKKDGNLILLECNLYQNIVDIHRTKEECKQRLIDYVQKL